MMMGFDLGGFIPGMLGLLGAGALFVVHALSEKSVAKGTRILVDKIDSLGGKISEVSLNIRITEERQANLTGGLARFESRLHEFEVCNAELAKYTHEFRHDVSKFHAATMVRLDLLEGRRAPC